MAIRLINKTEKLSCRVYGVTFFYRRPIADEIQEFTRKHMNRGELDEFKIGQEFLRRCVIGWEGDVTDADGKPAKFDPDLLMALPQKVQLALADVVASSVDGKHIDVDPS